MEGTIFSLLPPIITIAIIILTKRLFLSLGVGIALGALLYNQWNVIDSVANVYSIMTGVLSEDGKVLIFVVLIGVLSSLLYLSGGIYAFAEWGVKVAKTRVQAQMATMLLGFFTWFDDAFSCLFRGAVMRSVTDKYQVSHSKLSYLIHSTSAPIALLIPVSALSAFIVSIIAGVFDKTKITEFQPLEAFLFAIPANFYTISTIVLVFIVAYFGINVGQMRQDEKRAIDEGILFDTTRGKIPGAEDSKLPSRKDGKVADLLLPVLTLIVVTVLSAIWIGSEGSTSALELLKNTDVISALIYGGSSAILVILARLLSKKTPGGHLKVTIVAGVKTTLPSVAILFLALVTAEIISSLGVGQYLASLIKDNMALGWLPVIFFIFAAFISYSIGSTLGTAGLMLPIGAEIVAATDIAFLIPIIGAVLAGTVFGEHSSPLSDTTILASIGSSVHPIDHMITQLPYAGLSSISSIIGFLVLGFTQNVFIGLAAALITVVIGAYVLRNRQQRSGSSFEEIAK
ncbi:Na+/H+ antiporter NhaC family protein [Peribacillus saganii]|uniref:Na+/H+ antiporter NhaC family protein n=1 Tax=Peribacillus saganii TaxID=2303992 RepID=A0A372LNA1_9BACI|nr:Na+/H+ antiporter NhaC family protein [Peribacillus saganii]RFU67628.1 Na+/H+ antiporter NhaC family protein [Peribacillus saganii]